VYPPLTIKKGKTPWSSRPFPQREGGRKVRQTPCLEKGRRGPEKSPPHGEKEKKKPVKRPPDRGGGRGGHRKERESVPFNKKSKRGRGGGLVIRQSGEEGGKKKRVALGEREEGTSPTSLFSGKGKREKGKKKGWSADLLV